MWNLCDDRFFHAIAEILGVLDETINYLKEDSNAGN
jgi:hypothetical protein